MATGQHTQNVDTREMVQWAILPPTPSSLLARSRVCHYGFLSKTPRSHTDSHTFSPPPAHSHSQSNTVPQTLGQTPSNTHYFQSNTGSHTHFPSHTVSPTLSQTPSHTPSRPTGSCSWPNCSRPARKPLRRSRRLARVSPRAPERTGSLCSASCTWRAAGATG